jgi:hemerythrin-like metal-binding protein
MVGYVWNHLRFEEKLLKKHGYPALHEHMARHHSLEERLQEFFDLYDHEVTQRDQIARDVAQFLRDWLLGHIQDEDHKYAIFFYGKPIGNQRGRGPGG